MKMLMITGIVGKRFAYIIPAPLRKQFGLEEGSAVISQATKEGILIRPAVTVPVRRYSKTQKAAFLLNNAMSEKEYAEARTAVLAMGLHPDRISHQRWP